MRRFAAATAAALWLSPPAPAPSRSGRARGREPAARSSSSPTSPRGSFALAWNDWTSKPFAANRPLRATPEEPAFLFEE